MIKAIVILCVTGIACVTLYDSGLSVSVKSVQVTKQPKTFALYVAQKK